MVRLGTIVNVFCGLWSVLGGHQEYLHIRAMVVHSCNVHATRVALRWDFDVMRFAIAFAMSKAAFALCSAGKLGPWW